MSTFADLIASFDPPGPFTVPGDWTQGRTAFGGLTAALSVQAARQSEGTDLPPLRSAQFAFTAPAVDTLSLTSRRLRQGRSATSVAVEGVSADQICSHATLTFARSRDSRVDHDFLPVPDVAEPDDCPSFVEGSGLRPAFIDNFDVRRAGGALPLSGADTPRFLAWARHRGAADVDPAVALIALADCLPPAAMTSFEEWAPVSTMTWSVHLCADDVAATDGWFLLESVSTFTRHGYSHQQMTAWDADRRAVLTATQTVAVFA